VAHTDLFDLLIIGGGINGAGIARDAAGRGLRVALCEQNDLASGTSSASSKLVHGGLRYLEQYEFRLVREALAERETLLQIAPHLVRPLTFVLPWVPGMRPRWLLHLGLWMYDHLARRTLLAPARPLAFHAGDIDWGLKAEMAHGFSYSDCWVDDARLVIANCLDTAKRSSRILPRTRVLGAERERDHWRVTTYSAGTRGEIRARALVNAAGPWARDVLATLSPDEPAHRIRLIKGSHIVTPRLYEGRHAFILQNHDGRVILVIPYRQRYTLVGTTDIAHPGRPEDAIISAEEIGYLCAAVNRYFRRPIGSADVLWSFSGVRPLYDDGAANPSEITRDYKLFLDAGPNRPPLLSVYGGKLTTYRRLAEQVLDKLAPSFPQLGPAWTANCPLPGGEVAAGAAGVAAALAPRYPELPHALLEALAARHGTLAGTVLGDARRIADLGVYFGETLYAREVDYLVAREWAQSADDILWRRTKAGLALDDDGQSALERYMARRGRMSEPSLPMP